MIRFIGTRLLHAAFVMLAVSLIAFSLFRFVGDPIAQMVGQETSLEDQERLRESLGLNDPMPVQFARFVTDLVRGDFGFSFRTREPIGGMIKQRLPATLELSLVSLLISLAIGIPAGVYTAIKARSPGATAVLLISLVGVSVPTFVIGIALIYVFGVELGWLPTFGRGEVVAIGWWTTGLVTVSGLKALIMPAMTLAVYQLTLTMRLVRSEMMEVLRSDHIRFAAARGLPRRSIHFRHGLKGTLVPVVTIVGLQFGGIIAFSIVTESVFQWPGMGLLFLESIRFVDIPVMSVYLVIVAALFVVINLVVDITYFLIDPRIRVARANGGM
ncbi:MAG: ABC transporter permease [Alphaproteobacteria bacterium]